MISLRTAAGTSTPPGRASDAGDGIYDIVIVGAGAAGCVLAGRLSEELRLKVLLIEAGPDGPPHPDVTDAFPVSMANRVFHWRGLWAETGVDQGDGRPRAAGPYMQGFGVGGGSLINGMIAFRGFPQDYDRWRDLGATGWGWRDVLPYFNKLEHDLDFDGPMHGDSGPMPIRRVPSRDWAPFSRAFADALTRRGEPIIEDCNADFRDGVCVLPISSPPDRRISTADAYLTPAVRARSNLQLLPDARVDRILLSGRRAHGAVVREAWGSREIAAREVVVCGGALWSPALLLRSGIGDAAQLKSAGVAVAHDLPGVGRRLQNRPKVEVAAHLPARAMQAASERAIAQNCLRYSSGTPGAHAYDMGLKFINRTGWHALGRRVGAIAVCLYEPFSEGSVTLDSGDPDVSPVVKFNTLDDPRDADRLVEGLRLSLELLGEPEVRAQRHEAFLPDPRIAGSLAQRTAGNAFKAGAINLMLESGPLRRALLGDSRVDIASLAADEDALRDLVRKRASLGWHVCASCRMGAEDDPDAVVDPRLRVRGIEGLRIVDASVFPSLAGEGGMHIPVLMIAEKAADMIKQDWQAATAPVHARKAPETVA